MLYFTNVFIYLFILWPLYSPALVNGVHTASIINLSIYLSFSLPTNSTVQLTEFVMLVDYQKRLIKMITLSINPNVR